MPGLKPEPQKPAGDIALLFSLILAPLFVVAVVGWWVFDWSLWVAACFAGGLVLCGVIEGLSDE